ncbi:MAG: phosphomannomutase [Gammaproteobacteria bacterium]
MTKIDITCFKAYDVRGVVPDQLNEDVCERIGQATAQFLSAKEIVVGRDIRHSSQMLKDALVRGLIRGGASVRDLGECGTEEVYFATSHFDADGGIMVTASHNPAEYNGLKFVREKSKPISGDNGLLDIRSLAEVGEFKDAAQPGTVREVANESDYVKHLLSYIDVSALKPLKIVVNAGNGGAGKVVDLLEPHLPFEFVKVHHDIDADFPNGIPNPLLPENRKPTVAAISEHNADLGIAWDGDYDRCFFFDSQGAFVEGYYIVGLLGEHFLRREKGATIVHDPRLTWNTIAVADEFGGKAVQSKTGHAFIKQIMRDHDAAYGGEMSAHHYFRDFAYCDSGMIPWLLVVELMSRANSGLAELVSARQALFPASGEINRRLDDPAASIKAVLDRYENDAIAVGRMDGISVEFEDWRFSLRSSNTEPLVRLNVESRGDQALMQAKTAEILALLDG